MAIQERAELDVAPWLSDDELTEMTEISKSPTEFLDNAMDPTTMSVADWATAAGNSISRTPASPPTTVAGASPGR